MGALPFPPFSRPPMMHLAPQHQQLHMRLPLHAMAAPGGGRGGAGSGRPSGSFQVASKPEVKPQTTLYVGKLASSVDDDFLQSLLKVRRARGFTGVEVIAIKLQK